MSFLTDASLVFIPSGYKEDKAYSIKPTDGSGDLTFARASDGTRVNSEGYVERVPWNLLQQSNTFNTTWTKTNTSVSSGQSGYDGSLNAWLLTRTNTSGNLWQSVSLSGVQTFSVRLKKNTLDWVAIVTNNTGNNGTYFNLNTGTQGTQGTNVTSSSIESIGNGWYLCSITLNVSTTAIYLYPAQGDLNVGGSSGSIYIQDAQLNEGTLKPYFPTTNRQDVPRLDYSNGCPCLLLEPQRTNLALYSEQFDNGAWGTATSDGTTAPAITANYALSPNGTQNAERIVFTKPSADGEWALLRQTRTIALTSHTQSIWVKATDASQVGKYIDIYLYAGSYGEVYNFQLTNDWQRIAGVRTTPTSTSCEFAFGKARTTAGGSTLANMATDVLIWGAQLEAGSYPTSYIPTTSASVTRVADAAYKTGISSLIGQSEGVLFVEASALVNGADGRITISDGTINNRVSIEWDIDADTIKGFIGVGGNVSTTSHDQTDRNKIALVYSTSFAKLFVNGTLVATDTSSIPTMSGMAHIEYSNYNGTTPFVGNLYQTIVIPTALTDAQCIELTTL